jgi:surface antigen
MPWKKWLNSVRFIISLLSIILFSAIIINADKFYQATQPVFLSPSFVQIGENELAFVDIDMISVDENWHERWILHYIVQPWDTLGKISAMFGTTVSHIQKVNNLSSWTPIKPKQKLIITSEEKWFLYIVENKENVAIFAQKYELNLDDLLTLNYIQDDTELLQKWQEIFINIDLEKSYQVWLKERPEPIIPKITKVAYTPVISKPTVNRTTTIPASSGWWTSTKSKILRKWTFKKSISNQFYAWHCTWYVATQVPEIFPYVSETRQVRPFWGNANARYKWAQNAGIPTWTTPRIWAIIVYAKGRRRSYAGHVGIVIGYDAAKGELIIRDMNRAGKFIVTERIESASNSNIMWYVYRPATPCVAENGRAVCK